MINSRQVGQTFFNPLWPVLVYLFLAITTLHTQIPFLLSLHIETLVFFWVLVTSCISFFLDQRHFISYQNPILMSLLIGLLFITAPVLSSLFREDQLAVIADEEFRTLFKMILFSPCLFLLMKNDWQKKILLNSMIFFYVIFAFYFLYRFLILHEIRDFDQRPQLKIRHGDANFLCTFFSMMIPLALMQAWTYWQKKIQWKCLLFLMAAALLIICTFLTESRMGLIATLIGLLYLASRPLFSISKRYLVGMLLVSVVAVTFTSGERIISRFSELNDKSNSDRYLTWVNGAELFVQNPFFGVGMHKAKDSFYQNTGYPHFQSESKVLEVHNTFLKTAAELGLFGLAMFALLFLWPWKKLLSLHGPERYFLFSSMLILTLSLMTIGIVYKDLFVLHLFSVSALAIYTKPQNIPC